MPKQKFQYGSTDESDPDIAKIAGLRREISSLMMVNNDLVTQIWEIDQHLQAKPLDDTLKNDLLVQHKKLNTKLAEEGYETRINALKQKVYDLEIDKFGKSEVLENSPNAFNGFV